MGESDDEPDTSNCEECCTNTDQPICHESSSMVDLEFSEPVGPAEPHLPSDATPLDFFILMVGEDFLGAATGSPYIVFISTSGM